MRNSTRFCWAAFALLTLISISVHALPLGPDNFQDGTTMGWTVPGASPVPPVNVATGGPTGAGDAYMLLTASGQPGPGGRLSVLNSAQWAGNYATLPFAAIHMSVNNFGPSDLYLRLLFEDFAGPGPPVNVALTAVPVIVPAGSGWMEVAFPIAVADLVTAGLGTPLGALSSADTIRIFHNTAATFPGPGVGIPLVNASLGVDNIAVTHGDTFVPESSTLLMFAVGLGLLLLFKH